MAAIDLAHRWRGWVLAGPSGACFWGACLSAALLTGPLRAQPVPDGVATGAAVPLPVPQPPQVRVPSLDRVDGQALLLSAHWFPVAPEADPGASGPRPALVLLQGCGGAFDRQGRLSLRLRDYSALLNRQAWSVLVLDSFGARGTTQICTQKRGTRAITMTQRRRDVLGALAWLAQQPGGGCATAGAAGLVQWRQRGASGHQPPTCRGDQRGHVSACGSRFLPGLRI